MRRFFTPGWLGIHALAIALIGLFLAAGYWQLQRAGQGNMRSWAYAFEWPLFAVFALAMWVKMIHDELTGKTSPGEAEPGRTGGRAPPAGAGGTGGSRGPAAHGAASGRGDAFDDAGDPELAAYNRYLARLNAEANPEV